MKFINKHLKIKKRRDVTTSLNVPVLVSNPEAVELHTAVQSGNLCKVAELLLKGYEIDGADNRDDKVWSVTPLMIAAAMRDFSLVSFLLENGANPNAKDISREGCDRQPNWGGSTPLFYAIEGSAFDIEPKVPVDPVVLSVVALLLTRGADPNCWIGYGESAMGRAATRRSLGLIKLLSAHGGDVNFSASQDHHPLTIAALSDIAGDPVIEILEHMSSNGLDISWKSKSNKAGFLYWCDKNFFVMKKLIELGIDVNAGNNEGQSPLRLAIQMKNVPLALLLLKAGANREESFLNAKGETTNILRYAEEKGLTLVADRVRDMNQSNVTNSM